MNRIKHLVYFFALALLALPSQLLACKCIGPCSFLGTVDTMFLGYRNAGLDPLERIVIVKAVILDTIPNSYDGTRLKLLTQFFGRPVKDTFSHLAYSSNCEVSLRGFYERNQDTLFLMLSRRVAHINSIFGDTVHYEMSMCGSRFAVVEDDSIVEHCPFMSTYSAAAIADSLAHHIKTLKVETGGRIAASIYPNPVRDRFNIDGAAGSKASIMNIMGQLMLRSSITAPSQRLDISSLPAGNYFLLLRDKDGNADAVRIIKE